MKKAKFTFVLWCCVWPVISLLTGVMKMLLPTAPHLAFTFIVTAIFVPIMTYVIVPFVNRMLHKPT